MGAGINGYVESVVDSCHGESSCAFLAFSSPDIGIGGNGGIVGNIKDSCLGRDSCYGVASTGYGDAGEVGNITSSCHGRQSCSYMISRVGGSVGDISCSCHGDRSCDSLYSGLGLPDAKALSIDELSYCCNGASECSHGFGNPIILLTLPASCGADELQNNDGALFSVAISNDISVVGHPLSQSGSASVFVRDGANWTQQANLIANDVTEDAFFGGSVSISGDTIIVGAKNDDVEGIDSGSAYVFDRAGSFWSTWTQRAKLTASDGDERDYFGYSVSISGDTIVVGAFHDDDKGVSSGSAYVFVRYGSTWATWNWEQQKLTADDGSDFDFFGISVAVSGDTIVVGAPGDDDKGGSCGSVYVFVRNDPSSTLMYPWVQQAKLTANDGAENDEFGYSVSISGDTIVVGAPDSGSTYVFVRDGATWLQQEKLTPDDGSKNHQFGRSVAVSDDSIVVAATTSTYFFDKPSPSKEVSLHLF